VDRMVVVVVDRMVEDFVGHMDFVGRMVGSLVVVVGSLVVVDCMDCMVLEYSMVVVVVVVVRINQMVIFLEDIGR